MGYTCSVYVLDQVLRALYQSSFSLGIFIGAVVFLTWKEKQERKRVQEGKEEKEKESQAKGKIEGDLGTFVNL